mgnify:CR=1 FL=1
MSGNCETRTYLLQHLMGHQTELNPDNPRDAQVAITQLRRATDRWATTLDQSTIEVERSKHRKESFVTATQSEDLKKAIKKIITHLKPGEKSE